MDFRHSFFWSFANRHVTLAIHFASNVALARLLSPEEIGVYSVVVASLTLGQILRDFGLGAYLVRADTVDEPRVRTVFTLGMLISGAVGLCVVALAEPAAAFYDDERVARALTVLAANFFLLPLNMPTLALLRRDMRFDLLFRANLLATAAYAVSAVSLAVAGAGYMSMVWAALIQTAVMSLAVLPHTVSWRRFLPHLGGWRAVLGFGGLVSFTHCLTELGRVAPDIVIGRFLGFAPAGLFSRAQGTTRFFQQPLMGAVQSVCLPALTDLTRRGESLAPAFLLKLSYLSAVLWPALAAVGLLAQPLVFVLFGERWLEVVPLIQVLVLGSLLGVFNVLNADFLMALDRLRDEVRVTSIHSAARIALVLGAAQLSLEAVAWSLLAARLLRTGLYQAVLAPRLELTAAAQLGALWRSAAAVLATAAAIVAVGAALGPGEGDWSEAALRLAAGAAAGAVAALATLALLRHPLATEAARLGRPLLRRVAPRMPGA